MPKLYYLVDDMWRTYQGNPISPTTNPPIGPNPDPGVNGWQAAVDSRNYTTMQNWYIANTGYEALGYNVEDLVSGSMVSSYNGQVIEGVRGSVIRIAHSNVTVRGCLIEGGGTYGFYNNPTFGSTYTGTVVEYCTFVGGDPPIDKSAVLASSAVSTGIAATFRNCEVTGWSSGFSAYGGVAVEYCYVHDFFPSSVEGAHVSSMVARGSNVRFYRNYATEGGSPICSIYFDLNPVNNVTIQQNILSARMSQSGNTPSYLLFGKQGQYESPATNIVVGGNYLGNTAGVDFQFGQTAGMGNVQWGSNGNVRTSNIDFLTGAAI
jgi:hypothetical protein